MLIIVLETVRVASSAIAKMGKIQQETSKLRVNMLFEGEARPLSRIQASFNGSKYRKMKTRVMWKQTKNRLDLQVSQPVEAAMSIAARLAKLKGLPRGSGGLMGGLRPGARPPPRKKKGQFPPIPRRYLAISL